MCYAERSTSYSKFVRMSACLSITVRYYVKITQPIRSCGLHWRVGPVGSPMTLVSSWLTSARNTKGDVIGSRGERGRKNAQFSANKL